LTGETGSTHEVQNTQPSFDKDKEADLLFCGVIVISGYKA